MYIAKEKLLVAAYWDSTIRIYDEGDAEESQLLKVLSGGHKESEIQCFNYSSKISSNGLIAVWEFDTGKL